MTSHIYYIFSMFLHFSMSISLSDFVFAFEEATRDEFFFELVNIFKFNFRERE